MKNPWNKKREKTTCESCYELLASCECGEAEVVNDDGVNCSWCGHFHCPDESYWYSESDEEEHCHSCGKEFTWIGEPQGFTWTARRQ